MTGIGSHFSRLRIARPVKGPLRGISFGAGALCAFITRADAGCRFQNQIVGSAEALAIPLPTRGHSVWRSRSQGLIPCIST